MKALLLTLLLSLNVMALNPGDTAPDFELKDHDGKSFKLSSLKGQYIVLEWYNYGCPYVKKHYESKNMQTTQKLYHDNDLVTWVSIISSAKGKQGYLESPQAMRDKMAQVDSFAKYMLKDETGKVGQMYGAKTTPHIYIIDPSMKIRYVGAIDSIPSADISIW